MRRGRIPSRQALDRPNGHKEGNAGLSLQAVLLDMDGTLVDTEGLWWEAVVHVAARDLGCALAPSDHPHVLGRAIEDTAAYLLAHARTPTAYGTAVVSDMLLDDFADRVAREVRVLPGALALLDALLAARVPTALVTASPRRIVDLVMPSLGRHRFGPVVAAEDSPRNKPDPDPYLLAASRLGVDPRRCVVVEDSPTGVAAAVAAGCRVVMVARHGFRPPEMEAVSVTHSLEDLSPLRLRRLAAEGPG
ncbi:HAD family hydrolase [Sinosporangium siamense]|uniref:Hydrolase n=1 Tax=Sinosporangium siamense TaxID=1367973 RepID=A0A919RCZ4_9ACTN|nr:HAD family phosphatase [Sinosporangium siamense]GII91618.1 hydrolase [Sinosporangium siamense]